MDFVVTRQLAAMRALTRGPEDLGRRSMIYYVEIVPELSPNGSKADEKRLTETNGDESKLIEKPGTY